VLSQNLEIVRKFTPMEGDELGALRERCRVFAAADATSALKRLSFTTASLVASSTGIQRRRNCSGNRQIDSSYVF
jgi:hypothetical protein